MTKKEKKQWLEAIGKLRRWYKKYPLDKTPPNLDHSCPLCKLSEDDKCEDCLWVRFEGEGCMDSGYYFDTTRQRLDRLDRWKTRILKGDK